MIEAKATANAPCETGAPPASTRLARESIEAPSSGTGPSTDAAIASETDQLLALLYRQLRSLAGPRPDLDDIVQAAAERALKSQHRFERRSQWSTWTYGVAYRTLLDHDRWYTRLRRRYLSTEEVKLPEPRTVSDSEALFVEAERARRLYEALDELPSAKRAVVVLHDLEGMSASEVAVVVGTNEGTVRSRLRDGRAKLVALLERDPLFADRGSP